MKLAGTNYEDIIKKIWADLNPPTYLRPTLTRLKLPRLCRDMGWRPANSGKEARAAGVGAEYSNKVLIAAF
jgi:hypothetical protein